MRFIKLSATIFAVSLFSMACNLSQTGEVADTSAYPNEAAVTEAVSNGSDYFVRENLDLQRVGSLLESADNAEKFEDLLNSEDGVNNLDLNGDGYADYISVSEFQDRDDNERGLSLFSRFGPDIIQEIATIIFERGGLDFSDGRILLTGNEQIYGDDNYYETNRLDRSLGIVNWLFSDRDDYYNSPYYYENYPDDYEVYQVVETPVYRTRIEQIYPAPIFIQTANPAITQIKIKSPNHGKSVSKIYSKLAKPTKEQKEFRKNNPNKPEFVRIKNGGKKNDSFKSDNHPKGNRNDFEKPRKGKNERHQLREKPNKIVRENIKLSSPIKVEKHNMKPNKVEKHDMKPPKPQNNGKQNGGGNGKGNGGGGKGGGKKN